MLVKQQVAQRPFHVNKHHFCCFSNIFNKVFQAEARKQLGLNFGSSRKTLNCRGLTLDEIIKLDFEKMDFSEFIHEIQKNMKLPNIQDIEMRIKTN
jgi:conjugal transfer mating pair stabilization protein TraN